MPSRTSKRAKHATKAQSTTTYSKTGDQNEVESGSIHKFSGSVPHIEDNSSTHSVAPSTPPTDFTSISASTKKRKGECLDIDSDYESVMIRKGDPNVRNPTELPLVVTNSTGERKILWAKMDTGADMNVTTEKLIAKLGFTDLVQYVPPTSGALKVAEIGGKSIDIDRKISFSFTAGRKNTVCQDVEFWIPRQDSIDTEDDGVPDVLLGLPELIKYHMITVDPDFCNEPEEGLEVLAKKGSDEADRPVILLSRTKYPQISVRGK
jgi:hypothetical protein